MSYPITQNSSELEESHDIFQDSTFVNCSNCGCVQLQTLINPIKLYENCNRLIDETPTWKDHNERLSTFIKQNIPNSEILEIGSSSCPLYKFFKDTDIRYTAMDIADSKKRPVEVSFIQGNCEEFDFSGYTTVIMSHTFEHLYTPRKFVQNLFKAKVHSVFISIPNINYLYNSENISILNNEHTYYVGDKEIKYLFSQFGYSCKVSYTFRNHSLFYYFIYDPSAAQIPLEANMEIGKNMQKIFLKYETIMKNTIINTPCFICPGAHYGQKIHYLLKEYKDFILGFIDNDTLKQGKRVYGTSAYTFPPSILTKYKDTEISVILYAGPYTEELKKQLNELHPSIQFITFP